MSDEGYKRKLTAVLSADVAGYSRLMSQDDDATVRTLNSNRNMMSSLITRYQGRVVDSPGDNLLAEFESVIQAVSCAVEIQREMAERNAELTDDRKMEYRIGVNLGDVIEEDDRIYGDGVNIAARLENLAESGGICISGFVYNQIRNRLKLEYEFMGEQTVKNIQNPIPVYRVLSVPGAAAHRVIKAKKTVEQSWRSRFMIAVATLIVIITALVVWYFGFRGPSIEPASIERMAYSLPDKPSIAVLPFTNMSDDPKQEFLCDGITEDIITALSKNPKLFVIARNSTFTYKGKPVNVKQVSEDLGVRYVLEGSLRKSEDRVRVTAQLIDALSGAHVWAERYDRDLEDIFSLQDEIAMHILEAMAVKLTTGTMAYEASTKGTKNLDAYMKVVEGMHYAERITPDDIIRAKKMFEEAIILDPEYSAPYNLLALAHFMEANNGWSKSPMKSYMEASKLVKKGQALDDTHPTAYHVLAFIHLGSRQYDKALATIEHAIELAPNNSMTLFSKGLCLLTVGKLQEALSVFNQQLRIDPIKPDYAYLGIGWSNQQMKRYEEATKYYKKSVAINPALLWSYIGLACCYAALGKKDEAQAEALEILRLDPEFSVKKYAMSLPHKDQEVKDRYVSLLLKAGLPE